MAKDLTQGSPMKLIVGFSVPLMFGFLFQQFYNFVDTAIVGKTLGLNALAAVGSTSSLNFLILGFCMGVCSGFSISVARCFGARDYKALRRYVTNGAWLAVGFSVVLTVLTVLFCRDMLRATKTPGDIFEDAYKYIVVILACIPVTIFYNFLSCVIRAMGDSRRPVIYLIVASVINIVLDFVFILLFHLGVTGAALATGISQLVAGLGCLHTIRKMDVLTFAKAEWTPDWRYMKPLLLEGVPMGLQFSITAIGSVILSASVNGLGSVAVAAVTAASKLSMFFCCVFDALGSTIATYAGQNAGAGEIGRIRRGIKCCTAIGLGYALFALLLIVCFGRGLIGLFVDVAQVQATEDAYQFLVTNALFYVPLLFVNLLRLLIQGVGRTSLAVFAGVCEMVARTLIGFFLVPRFGFVAACFASPVAWLCADLFLFPASLHVLKNLAASRVASIGQKAEG
ncbi:MAG: MATE family efflux transporter [Clostridia bacterium]